MEAPHTSPRYILIEWHWRMGDIYQVGSLFESSLFPAQSSERALWFGAWETLSIHVHCAVLFVEQITIAWFDFSQNLDLQPPQPIDAMLTSIASDPHVPLVSTCHECDRLFDQRIFVPRWSDCKEIPILNLISAKGLVHELLGCQALLSHRRPQAPRQISKWFINLYPYVQFIQTCPNLCRSPMIPAPQKQNQSLDHCPASRTIEESNSWNPQKEAPCILRSLHKELSISPKHKLYR